MILFFHFVCLLARYLLSNISKSIRNCKVHSDDENGDESVLKVVLSQSSIFSQNKKVYIKKPLYEGGTLKFFPPVYVQRYETVALILQDSAWRGKIQKVADFGCSELNFFMYLKNIKGVNEILEIDIDRNQLERHMHKVAPLSSDYLMGKNSKPLNVYILNGNIADYDEYLIGTDAVIGIELIEHLNEEDFRKMPCNVFHQIKPKLVIFTTPNADFNSLFPKFSGLRHNDHKFEWSRKEFYNWTQEIVSQYPDYSVKFYGVGAGPEGTENLGCCSQMAVFERIDDPEVFSSAREEPGESGGIHNYELLKHYEYPVYKDIRTTEEKILHEIRFQLPHLITLTDFYNYDESECEIPLTVLKEYVTHLCPDEEELRNILENNGMKIRLKNYSWFVICTESDLNSSENSLGDEDWLNEELIYPADHDNDDEEDDHNDNDNEDDIIFNDQWDWNETDHQIGDTRIFQSVKSVDLSKMDSSEKIPAIKNVKRQCIDLTKAEIKSAPESCNQLNKILNCANKSHPNFDSKNEVKKKRNILKSKIPRMVQAGEGQESTPRFKRSHHSYVCKHPRKISKSCSLDSCLENINCKLFESESYYLNLIPGGSVPLRNVSSFSYSKSKRVMNDSGSSLFSSSLDRAADSGYPFSFSPPDADMTPEQVDELFTENEMMSRSTSASSEVEMVDAVNYRIPHDLFAEVVVVENGDLANNNRDGEGNNVEGLMGQRLVNEVAAERDPNDNMFFPEIEEFPHWLLNLVELVEGPVFIPIDGVNID